MVEWVYPYSLLDIGLEPNTPGAFFFSNPFQV